MGRVLRRVGRVGKRAQRSERGAALVEAALIIPLILLIVFGAIEYGFAFKDAAAVAGAARSGARIASAEPRDPNMPQDAATAVATALHNFPHVPSPEIWVYLSGDNGYPLGTSNFASCGLDCVKYTTTWNTSTDSFQLNTPTGSIPINDEHVCPTDSAATWSRVGVYVKATHQKIITNLLPSPTTLTDHAVFRLEPVLSSKCP
jgi:Flp pilus assembly protein TadG